jgi:hypothetical protein
MTQLRLTVGDAPRYDASGNFNVPYYLTVDAALGVRHWVAPDYGIMMSVEAGAQVDQYFRVGLDFAIFAEL